LPHTGIEPSRQSLTLANDDDEDVHLSQKRRLSSYKFSDIEKPVVYLEVVRVLSRAPSGSSLR
jgi:hypothetical protein